MKNPGKAWLIIEEHFHAQDKRLVALLKPSISSCNVAKYLLQSYIDSYASIGEKIAFKKGRSLPAYEVAMYGSHMLCGHEPQYHGIYCHKLRYEDGELFYWFYNGSKNESSSKVKTT